MGVPTGTVTEGDLGGDGRAEGAGEGGGAAGGRSVKATWFGKIIQGITNEWPIRIYIVLNCHIPIIYIHTQRERLIEPLMGHPSKVSLRFIPLSCFYAHNHPQTSHHDRSPIISVQPYSHHDGLPRSQSNLNPDLYPLSP